MNTVTDIFPKPQPCAALKLPKDAIQHFNHQQHVLARDVPQSGFMGIYRFTFPDGSSSYLADALKVYKVGEEPEREMYLADFDPNGEFIGYGKVEVEWDEQGELRPFVGYTETAKAARRVGLGLRRLRIMNEATTLTLGQPLNSSTTDKMEHPSSRTRWEKLVEMGLAEEYQEKDQPRWRFKR